ncbi:DUF29 domain-containing protein [uncultured Thiodictyon sp.]|uniref:DUF29 domain-containing protein n=1 Tax=uncultured Thiodictyon sp. TaxID=1846217 RepID=UPI0026015611|nr:DUF29 domain-containing protein [uncultured Thiodictyon sp.]
MTLVPTPITISDLYEIDFSRWLFENAALLRQGRFAEADIPNIAEELECLGRGERRAVENHLVVLLLHLLKWELQPEQRSRNWRASIYNARDGANDLLRDSPSLVSRVPELVAESYEEARDNAILETELPESSFSEVCPYTVEQVLDETFWPGPGGAELP